MSAAQKSHLYLSEKENIFPALVSFLPDIQCGQPIPAYGDRSFFTQSWQPIPQAHARSTHPLQKAPALPSPSAGLPEIDCERKPADMKIPFVFGVCFFLVACEKPQPPTTATSTNSNSLLSALLDADRTGGRYQLIPAGQNTLLIDTATAQTWILNFTTNQNQVWLPLPLPNELRKRKDILDAVSPNTQTK